jgi:hypothetical protein
MAEASQGGGTISRDSPDDSELSWIFAIFEAFYKAENLKIQR